MLQLAYPDACIDLWRPQSLLPGCSTVAYNGMKTENEVVKGI